MQQQKAAFLSWVNYHFDSVGIPDRVSDIKDFKDGKVLWKLVQQVTNSSDPSFAQPALTSTKQLPQNEKDNLSLISKALKTIQEEWKIPLEKINQEDIVSANEPVVLDLLWKIILRYISYEPQTLLVSSETKTQVYTRRRSNSIQDKSIKVKTDLLDWISKHLKPLELPVKCTAFDKSWQSGLFFLAILYRFNSDLIPATVWTDRLATIGDSSTWSRNCNEAFQICHDVLGVPKLLNVELLQAEVEDRAVLFYISLVSAAIRRRMINFDTCEADFRKTLDHSQASFTKATDLLSKITISLDVQVNASEILREGEVDSFSGSALFELEKISQTNKETLARLKGDLSTQIYYAYSHFVKNKPSQMGSINEIRDAHTRLLTLGDTLDAQISQKIKFAKVVDEYKVRIGDLYGLLNQTKHRADALVSDKTLLSEVEFDLTRLEEHIEKLVPLTGMEGAHVEEFNQSLQKILKKLRTETIALSRRIADIKKSIGTKSGPEELFTADADSCLEWIAQKKDTLRSMVFEDEFFDRIVETYIGDKNEKLARLKADLLVFRGEVDAFEPQIKKLQEACLRFVGSSRGKRSAEHISSQQRDVDEQWQDLLARLKTQTSRVAAALNIENFVEISYLMLEEFDIKKDELATLSSNMEPQDINHIFNENDTDFKQLEAEIASTGAEHKVALETSKLAQESFKCLETTLAALRKTLSTWKIRAGLYNQLMVLTHHCADLEDRMNFALDDILQLQQPPEGCIVEMNSQFKVYASRVQRVEDEMAKIVKEEMEPLLFQIEKLRDAIDSVESVTAIEEEALDSLAEINNTLSHVSNEVTVNLAKHRSYVNFLQRVLEVFLESDPIQKELISITEDLTTIPLHKFETQMKDISKNFSEQQDLFSSWNGKYASLIGQSDVLKMVRTQVNTYVGSISNDFAKRITDSSILKKYDVLISRLKQVEAASEAILKKVGVLTLPMFDKRELLKSAFEKVVKQLDEMVITERQTFAEFDEIEKNSAGVVDFKPDLRSRIKKLGNTVNGVHDTLSSKRAEFQRNFSTQEAFLSLSESSAHLTEINTLLKSEAVGFDEVVQCVERNNQKAVKFRESMNELRAKFDDERIQVDRLKELLTPATPSSTLTSNKARSHSRRSTMSSKIQNAASVFEEEELSEKVNTLQTGTALLLQDLQISFNDTLEYLDDSDKRFSLFGELEAFKNEVIDLKATVQALLPTSEGLQTEIEALSRKLSTKEAALEKVLHSPVLTKVERVHSVITPSPEIFKRLNDLTESIITELKQTADIVSEKQEKNAIHCKTLSLDKRIEEVVNTSKATMSELTDLDQVSETLLTRSKASFRDVAGRLHEFRKSAIDLGDKEVIRKLDEALGSVAGNVAAIDGAMTRLSWLSKIQETIQATDSATELVSDRSKGMNLKHLTDNELVFGDHVLLAQDFKLKAAEMSQLLAESESQASQTLAHVSTAIAHYKEHVPATCRLDSVISKLQVALAGHKEMSTKFQISLSLEIQYCERSMIILEAAKILASLKVQVEALCTSASALKPVVVGQGKIETSKESVDLLASTVELEEHISNLKTSYPVEVNSEVLSNELILMTSKFETARQALQEASVQNQKAQHFDGFINRILSFVDTLSSINFDDESTSLKEDYTALVHAEHIQKQTDVILAGIAKIKDEYSEIKRASTLSLSSGLIYDLQDVCSHVLSLWDNVIESMRLLWRSKAFFFNASKALTQTAASRKDLDALLESPDFQALAVAYSSLVASSEVKSQKRSACSLWKDLAMRKDLAYLIQLQASTLQTQLPLIMAKLENFRESALRIGSEFQPRQAALLEVINEAAQARKAKVHGYTDLAALEEGWIAFDKESMDVKAQVNRWGAEVDELYGEQCTPKYLVVLRAEIDSASALDKMDVVLRAHNTLRNILNQATSLQDSIDSWISGLISDQKNCSEITAFAAATSDLEHKIRQKQTLVAEWKQMRTEDPAFDYSPCAIVVGFDLKLAESLESANSALRDCQHVIAAFESSQSQRHKIRQAIASYLDSLSEIKKQAVVNAAPVEEMLNAFTEARSQILAQYQAWAESTKSSFVQQYKLLSNFAEFLQESEKEFASLAEEGYKLSSDKHKFITTDNDLKQLVATGGEIRAVFFKIYFLRLTLTSTPEDNFDVDLNRWEHVKQAISAWRISVDKFDMSASLFNAKETQLLQVKLQQISKYQRSFTRMLENTQKDLDHMLKFHDFRSRITEELQVLQEMKHRLSKASDGFEVDAIFEEAVERQHVVAKYRQECRELVAYDVALGTEVISEFLKISCVYDQFLVETMSRIKLRPPKTEAGLQEEVLQSRQHQEARLVT